MTIASRVVARLASLPPAQHHQVGVELDLPATMPDGAVLLADRYFPPKAKTEAGSGIASSAPIVLIRTPYGRREFAVFGHIFAERGYQAVIQSVRGTFGSGGTFDPFFHEERDGRATLDWLATQPWFVPCVGMFGASYLGFVQFAVAPGAPAYLKALAMQIATPNRSATLYESDSFDLDLALSIAQTFATQERSLGQRLLTRRGEARSRRKAYLHLPLCEADTVAVGHPVPCFQDWLDRSDSSRRRWADIDYSGRVGAITAPATMVGGWYDLYLPAQIEAFAALRDAGRKPRLVIGPWAHTAPGTLGAGLREALAWFDAHLRTAAEGAVPGAPDPARDASQGTQELPVRVFVMGSRRWINLPDWPPPHRPERWYLQAGFRLSTSTPAQSSPDRYVYDPSDPTPIVGGTTLDDGGAKDNRKREQRKDLLVYTSEPLVVDLEIMGPVQADLYVQSSLAHTDFFVRLCDVDARGKSTNLCDGFVRLGVGGEAKPVGHEGGTMRLCIDLWPTANRFQRGHRVRLQVSSGAHPRYARNLGTGEPLATGVTMKIAEQEVHHDPDHPSCIMLPVRAS